MISCEDDLVHCIGRTIGYIQLDRLAFMTALSSGACFHVWNLSDTGIFLSRKLHTIATWGGRQSHGHFERCFRFNNGAFKDSEINQGISVIIVGPLSEQGSWECVSLAICYFFDKLSYHVHDQYFGSSSCTYQLECEGHFFSKLNWKIWLS